MCEKNHNEQSVLEEYYNRRDKLLNSLPNIHYRELQNVREYLDIVYLIHYTPKKCWYDKTDEELLQECANYISGIREINKYWSK